MIITAAILALRHHRFELGAAAIVALLSGVVAILIRLHMDGAHVPPGCFEVWLTAGPEQAGTCAAPVSAFAQVNIDEADKLFVAMAVMPFAVGLVAGVPLVSRELEDRTAQTAWSLAPSRAVWLGLQIAPAAIVVLGTTSFAAIAAGAVEAPRTEWIHSAISDVTLHGPPVVARAMAALGIGVLAGAIAGRQIPALLVGVLLIGLMAVVSADVEGRWLRMHKEVVAVGESLPAVTVDAGLFEPVWRGPAGEILRIGESLDGDPAPLTGPPGAAWAAQHPGWESVWIGIPAARAPELAAVDASLFIVVGLLATAGGFLVVDRRRPM